MDPRQAAIDAETERLRGVFLRIRLRFNRGPRRVDRNTMSR
jgi:hypothetical protein